MKSFLQFLNEAMISRKDAMKNVDKQTNLKKSQEWKSMPWWKKAWHGTEKNLSGQLKTQHMGVPNVSLLHKHSQKNKDLMKKIYSHKRGQKSPVPVERIPLDSVVTRQHQVSSSVVKDKIAHGRKGGDLKNNINPTRLPIYLRLRSGHHVVLDGNHKTIADKERGKTHTRGYILHQDSEEKRDPPKK
jgi:hypothetical protein